MLHLLVLKPFIFLFLFYFALFFQPVLAPKKKLVRVLFIKLWNFDMIWVTVKPQQSSSHKPLRPPLQTTPTTPHSPNDKTHASPHSHNASTIPSPNPPFYPQLGASREHTPRIFTCERESTGTERLCSAFPRNAAVPAVYRVVYHPR